MNLILHTDEINLKGANQPAFYRQLIKNLKSLFLHTKVCRIEGGLWMENVEEIDLYRLALIPGIANFAGGVRCGTNVDEIKSAIDQLLLCRGGVSPPSTFACIPTLGAETAPLRETETFRISCERSYKNYQLSSKQIENQIGEYVREKTKWKVRLNHPDLNIHIAIGSKEIIVYGNTTDGCGGLPTGSSGKVLCLLSGGIDSPAAAYTMMRRGAEVALIHFQNQTQVTEEVGQKIFDIAKVLSRYQPRVQLIIVPFADLQRQVIMKVPAEYRMLITRRLFFRVAEEINHSTACHPEERSDEGSPGSSTRPVKGILRYAQNDNSRFGALITGDSLGQVASQTLANLTAVYDATNILTLSPLIGTNKRDIIDLARKIGTLGISQRSYEDCCSLFVAKHPQTKAKLEIVRELEKAVDISALDKQQIKSYYIG